MRVWERRKLRLTRKRDGKPERFQKILHAKEISTVDENWQRVSEADNFDSQPGCRSRWRKPKTSRSRAGNSDCGGWVIQQWITRAAIRKNELFGQTAKAFCWSRRLTRNPAHGVSQSGFCGCQCGAILPEIGKSARLMMMAPPEPDPDFVRNGNSGTELSRSPGMTNQLASVNCGDHEGKSPVNLNSVA